MDDKAVMKGQDGIGHSPTLYEVQHDLLGHLGVQVLEIDPFAGAEVMPDLLVLMLKGIHYRIKVGLLC